MGRPTEPPDLPNTGVRKPRLRAVDGPFDTSTAVTQTYLTEPISQIAGIRQSS